MASRWAGIGSRQDEIHDLLCARRAKAKTVVRLKGGDPFLFGRGGEEAEYLADMEFPSKWFPGVSSCLSAPLSAGIAVTHRDRASSVAIVTGHQASEHEDRVDWQALSKVDTLVVLMGIHQYRTHHQEVDGGRLAPDTPAAIIQMPSGRVSVSSLQRWARLQKTFAAQPSSLRRSCDWGGVRLREKLKHHQRHLGQLTGRDPLISPTSVPVPIPAGGATRSVLGHSKSGRSELW